MKKYAAALEYDGTKYHGWQLQRSVPTIQGEMERVLGRILNVPTRVHGSGRTDAGVHAKGQVIHFSAQWDHSAQDLQRACNALLPADIVVHGLEQTRDDFHARHSASLKTYRYQILNRALRSPFDRLYSWHFPHALDVPLMNEAAAHLVGVHDFASFGAPTDGTPSTIREIKDAAWEDQGPGGFLAFTITGSGFLRYMVRSIVGTLVLVGSRRMMPDGFFTVLQSCDRSQAGPTAPPHGLCLMKVYYESDPEDSAAG